jgi:hypothetical protein
LYQSQFRALNISERNFGNALPEIRNRCAHGWAEGRNREPIVGLGFNADVGELLSLLITIVSRELTARGMLKVIEHADIPSSEK